MFLALAGVPLVSLMALLLSIAILLPPQKKLQNIHWTEKARLLWPARKLLGIGYLFITCLWCYSLTSVFLDPARGFLIFCVLLLAALVRVPAAIWVERRTFDRPVPLLGSFYSLMILGFFLSPLLGLVPALLVSGLYPAELNWTALLMLAACVAFAIYVNFHGGVFFARALGVFKTPPPRLVEISKGMAEKVGFNINGVYLFKWHLGNAAAFPFARAIAISDLLYEHLSDEEVAAVIGHEIAHLKEPALIKGLRLLPQLMIIALFGISPIMGTLGLAGFLGIMVLSLLIFVVVRAKARAMEKRADQTGHTHQENPGVYARALEKIYELNMMPAVTGSKRAVHPDLYDRMLAAKVIPNFPKPAKPKSIVVGIIIMGLAALAIILMLSASGISLIDAR